MAPPPQASATAPKPTIAVVAPLPPIPEVVPVPDPTPLLDPYAVTSNIARRTLYTWTTKEQVAELSREKVLLSRTQSASHGPAAFTRAVERIVYRNSQVAGLLRSPAFQRLRFAWPSAWPTFLGAQGESYGDELIRVTLRKEARFLVLRTSTDAFELIDADGKSLPLDRAISEPGKIAAVFFVHDVVLLPGASPTSQFYMNGGLPPFREYVLCNESMIEEWAVASADIREELTKEADALDALAAHVAQQIASPLRADRWAARVTLLGWQGLVEDRTAIAAYEEAIAFPNEKYVPTEDMLKKLAELLRQLKPSSEPIVHKPTAPFPGAKPVMPPPPPPVRIKQPIRRGGGSFY